MSEEHICKYPMYARYLDFIFPDSRASPFILADRSAFMHTETSSSLK